MLALMLALMLLPLTQSDPASAQPSGRVGATTSRDAKAAIKVCNIMDFGAVSSAMVDVGAAVTAAWNACKTCGQVYIPPGSYGLSKWVHLTGGSRVAVNIEGTIFRMSNGTSGGAMLSFDRTDDLELYSANSKGAVQGYGYQFHSSKYIPASRNNGDILCIF
jgi:rhamnogalacturonan hydrolase